MPRASREKDETWNKYWFWSCFLHSTPSFGFWWIFYILLQRCWGPWCASAVFASFSSQQQPPCLSSRQNTVWGPVLTHRKEGLPGKMECSIIPHLYHKLQSFKNVLASRHTSKLESGSGLAFQLYWGFWLSSALSCKSKFPVIRGSSFGLWQETSLSVWFSCWQFMWQHCMN